MQSLLAVSTQAGPFRRLPLTLSLEAIFLALSLLLELIEVTVLLDSLLEDAVSFQAQSL